MMRRTFLFRALQGLAGAALLSRAPAGLAASAPPPVQHLAMAWREPARTDGTEADRVGVMAIDWAQGRMAVLASHPAPGRAHGLLPLPDGGFLAVATRPGRWLLRCDAQGQVVGRHDLAAGPSDRTLNGHAERLAGDDRHIVTTETDPVRDEGWLVLRDLRTLQAVAAWRLPGRDPHQVLSAADGSLMVALGGLPRDRAGRKIDLGRMDPSLVRLDPARGETTGQWRLDDPRLSLRHLAWSAGPDEASGARLGVALQAEHDDPAVRRQAPVLAVWAADDRLRVASADARAGGYTGDIAAGPQGGFVVSAEKVAQGLWWRPEGPDALTRIAELGEVCPLAAWQDRTGHGVLLGARRGLARWHTGLPPAMLPWPIAMAPDNHAVLLPAA